MSEKYYGMFEPQKKKKSKPKNNKRIDEYIECDICGKAASSTHEIFGQNNRNLSITKGWAIKVCTECHEKCHRDAKFDRKLRAKWQKRIMSEENIFSFDEWREKYGIKNYVD